VEFYADVDCDAIARELWFFN